MSRPKRREQEPLFDPELAELPDGARWREWMGRVEAAIFSARDPVPREALAKLVGQSCNLDDLLSPTFVDEFARGPMNSSSSPAAINCAPSRASPPRSARRMLASSATRAARADADRILAVTAIAYLQPATRAEISRLAGKEISRDVIGRLKSLDLIAAGPRAPEPGAPYAYVTTKKVPGGFWARERCVTFPTSNGSKTKACCSGLESDIDLDGALGLVEDDGRDFRRRNGVRGRRARRHDG